MKQRLSNITKNANKSDNYCWSARNQAARKIANQEQRRALNLTYHILNKEIQLQRTKKQKEEPAGLQEQ